MKKKSTLVIVLVLMFLCAMALSACNGEGFTIYFDVDGETYAEIKTAGEEELTIPNPPIKDGYTFAGWYWLDGSPFTVESLLNTPLTADIRVFAKWLTIAQYTITFDSDGGSAVSPIAAHGGEAIFEPSAPTKEGFTFGGWFVEDYSYEYVFSVMPGYNLTLYAKWIDNTPLATTYTITFDSNDGSEVAPLSAEAGASVSAPATPEKEGYVFGGWYTDNVTFAVVYTFGFMPEENTTLYAKWMGEIVYYLDNGVNDETNPEYIEAEDIILGYPQKTGYIFEGWYNNEGFDGDAIVGIPSGSAGISLYARWLDILTYNVFSVSITPQEPRLALAPEKSTYDDIIEVEVTLDGNVVIAGYQLEIEYNDAQFLYVSNSLVSDAVTSVGSGYISVSWTGDGSNITEGKTVVVFRLRVINSVRPDVRIGVDMISCVKRDASDTDTVNAEYIANVFYNADYIEGGKV